MNRKPEYNPLILLGIPRIRQHALVFSSTIIAGRKRAFTFANSRGIGDVPRGKFGREAEESESSYRVRCAAYLKASKTCRAR